MRSRSFSGGEDSTVATMAARSPAAESNGLFSQVAEGIHGDFSKIPPRSAVKEGWSRALISVNG
jgi:hypothetical protein